MGQLGDGQCLDYAEVGAMSFVQYCGIQLVVPENESEFLGYFEVAKQHRVVPKKCTACGIMRYLLGVRCL
jgi:hypothetical protein